MSARWSPKLLVALLILSTEQAKAKDITEMPLNSVVENVVTIGKKQVPLLKGAWEVVRSSSNISMTVGSPLGGALLARKVGDKYTGGIYIRTNMEMVSHGWKRHRTICDRDNVHFNVSDRNYNHETADCWQVNHFVNTYSTKGGEFYQGLKDWMRETFSTSSVLTLQYFRNDVNDYLNIYYIFDPTNYGFPVLLEVETSNNRGI